MSKMKYFSAQDWFMKTYKNLSAAELHMALIEIVKNVDGDVIQDIFESEMDRDGYFDK